MSLRAFHILFVVLAEAVTFGFAWWSLVAHGGWPGLGITALVFGITVLVYAVAYFRKLFRLEVST